MKQVILIGDSIRMGYSPYVARELEGQAKVWGPEENGGTSRNVLAHLEEWILSRPADVVHLNCGLHDLARDPENPGPRISLQEYESNLREILGRIKNSGRKIVWATTTPVNEKNHHTNKDFDRREADVESYNALALRVARELDVPVNDLHRAVREAGAERVLLPDGVHFTEEGSAVLGKEVAEFVRKFL